MNTPTISVIMPVWNRSDVTPRAIASVLRQTFDDLELIVVNDSSTDDLEVEVSRFQDSRIRMVTTPSNVGSAAARNIGIRMAQGTCIAFLDSDDEWHADKLMRQHAALSTAPDAIMSITSYHLKRDKLNRQETRLLRTKQDWYGFMLGGCTVAMCSCALVTRSAFDEIGLFDESMKRLYDWDWLLRYTARYPIQCVEEPLATLHSGGHWPSAAVVREASRQLWERHAHTVRARSPALSRLFRSSLVYEVAAAHYHAGQTGTALRLVMRMLLLYPWRSLRFYRHLFRRGVDVARGHHG